MRNQEWQIKDVDYCQELNRYSSIVIGDESCIYKALNKKWLDIINKAGELHINVRFLTPITPQKYVEELVTFIRKLSEVIILKVTFNDFGVLYLCKKMIEENRIIPVLGRILTRSILDCQWNKKLIEGENTEINQLLLNYSFDQIDKINVIKKMGINELEINFISDQNISDLKKYQIKITCYLSNTLEAVGRLCYIARYYELKLPNCVNHKKCLSKIKYELVEKWGRDKQMFEEPTSEFKNYFKDNYVEGNAVYKALCISESKEIEKYDFVIITE